MLSKPRVRRLSQGMNFQTKSSKKQNQNYFVAKSKKQRRSNSGREEQQRSRPESVAGDLTFGIGRELSLILKEIKVELSLILKEINVDSFLFWNFWCVFLAQTYSWRDQSEHSQLIFIDLAKV